MNDIERVAHLAVISDADASRLVSDRTRADLAARIMATPRSAGSGAASVTAGRIRRRWFIGVPAVAGLAAAILLTVFLAGPGHSAGPGPNGPTQARALAFIRHGGYIDVIVRNPTADPRRYRAEFKAHGLNISLRLVPASPSIVGTVVFFDGNSSLKVITAKGRCFTGGGGETCPVGIRVPYGYRGHADLAFGRPARAGEHYETTAPATVHGEALYGLRIDGRHVRAVLRMIRARHVTAPLYHITTKRGVGKLVHHVPLTWFVYGADPWAPGQVALSVGPTRHPRPVSSPQPASPAPTPTPTSSAG